ncbi:A24 family peptidase [Vibrio sp. DW001]|uniref:prepilin peptidase n=1 Tax=Vibrio sp. DW001 TaxID=2912315 RepID=UPI0023AE72F3|nr:A24 family peptidase [Vibrio sp. DW001]WED26184.1 A24 family peptidase [Vibrio sp. DW001]
MELFEYYPWLYPVFAGIFGLIVGSFLNVVIHRVPIMMEREWKQDCAETFPELNIPLDNKKFNLSIPRSSCPRCKTPLRLIDNIPIISWLLLKGKCHHCKEPVSIRYPLVELLTAIMSCTIAYYFELSYYSVALIFFSFALISATFIDLDTMLLPDSITLPLTWFGLFLALIGWSPVSLQDAVIGAIAGYLCLWSVYWVFKIVTGKEGMGYGDFKLLAALGAWLGWQHLPMIVLLSSFVGLIFGLIQLRLQKKGIDRQFPFGPYLAIAGWISLLWGNQIMVWYYSSVLGI